MTKEVLEKANELVNDIDNIDIVLKEREKRHWVRVICLVSISGAILQSFGQVNKPLISLCVGAVVKCVLNFVLVGVEKINILGAPIATCACYVVMIGMNVFFLRKYLGGCGAIIVNTLKTAVAAALMGVAAYFANIPLGSALGMKIGGLASICVGVVVYAVLIVALKIVTLTEIKSMLKRGK